MVVSSDHVPFHSFPVTSERRLDNELSDRVVLTLKLYFVFKGFLSTGSCSQIYELVIALPNFTDSVLQFIFCYISWTYLSEARMWLYACVFVGVRVCCCIGGEIVSSWP